MMAREAPELRAPGRRTIGLASPQEVARALEVTERTLARWRSEGGGPGFVKVGRRVFYRWSAINRWIERRERGGR